MITSGAKEFSEEKHATGNWRTRQDIQGNRISRAIWNFLSFKRRGVDQLAKQAKPSWRVLDCGAGTGAYSQWFLNRCPCAIIALDWSIQALRELQLSKQGKIYVVCADAEMMPIKSQCIDASFTIDTLGHVHKQVHVLDEMVRVLKSDSPLFVHSESGDYKMRWPDRMLRKKLGYDMIANIDGHISLLLHRELQRHLLERFCVLRAWSPGGLLGWLIGYPEKYHRAFKEARCHGLAIITATFSYVKMMPMLGAVLRFVNAITNHLELYLGIHGGGSSFAELRTPKHTNGDS